jgi:hypothetical protein
MPGHDEPTRFEMEAWDEFVRRYGDPKRPGSFIGEAMAKEIERKVEAQWRHAARVEGQGAKAIGAIELSGREIHLVFENDEGQFYVNRAGERIRGKFVREEERQDLPWDQ